MKRLDVYFSWHIPGAYSPFSSKGIRVFLGIPWYSQRPKEFSQTDQPRSHLEAVHLEEVCNLAPFLVLSWAKRFHLLDIHQTCTLPHRVTLFVHLRNMLSLRSTWYATEISILNILNLSKSEKHVQFYELSYRFPSTIVQIILFLAQLWQVLMFKTSILGNGSKPGVIE